MRKLSQMTRRSYRRDEETVRGEHLVVFEDPQATSDGRIWCSCGWASEIAPRHERFGVHARHVEHAVNAEEWCWGDQEKARQRYYQIEKGAMV